jgi:hypothetical protein
MKLLCITIILIVVIAIIVVFTQQSTENFTQGYNYLIAGCIQKCEQDQLRNDPFFVPLQEGGYMANSYCEQMCASEYNKNNINPCIKTFPSSGACMVRKPSYQAKPLTWCRYFDEQYFPIKNKNFDLIGNDVKTVNPNVVFDCNSNYPI